MEVLLDFLRGWPGCPRCARHAIRFILGSAWLTSIARIEEHIHRGLCEQEEAGRPSDSSEAARCASKGSNQAAPSIRKGRSGRRWSEGLCHPASDLFD